MTTTILTADDDQAFRSMLSSLLHQDATFTLIGEAKNGEDAVCAAQRLCPDIVLLDITMPRVNGFDATRRIKSDRPQTKVIVLTVHANFEQVALANGADAFIPKRCLSSDLLRTIHALMKPPAVAPPQRPDRPESILVIGNDTRYRRAVADDLRRKIAASIEESGGSEKEVLAKVSTLRPDVVAVAWEDSAAWIVRCLRGLFPDIGIVALTNRDSDDHSEAVDTAGADAVVAKNRFESELAPLVVALMRDDQDGGAAAKRDNAGCRADADVQKNKARV